MLTRKSLLSLILFGFSSVSIMVYAQNSIDPDDMSSLRLSLSHDALAYARVPLFSNLSADNNRYFQDEGFQSARDELEQLRDSLRQTVMATMPPTMAAMSGDLLELILEHMQSPLEIAIAPSSIPGMPIPQLLISTSLDLSQQELAERLTIVSQNSPIMNFQGNIDANGIGTMMMGNMPLVFQHIDQGFKAIISPTGSADTLLATFAGEAGLTHPMTMTETGVDASQKGTFIWVNTASLLATATMMMPPEQLLQIQQAGLDKLKSLSVGMGRGDNQGGLILSGEFIEDNPLLPNINNEFDFTTRGEPDFLFSVSLPDSAVLELWINMIGASALQSGEPNPVRLMESQLGLKLSDLTDALGPEIAIFKDTSGFFVAVKVREQQALADLLLSMENLSTVDYSSREFDGNNFHHLVFSPPIPAQDDATADMRAQLLTQMILGKSHFFWMEEEDYLVFATVPQALMERQNAGQAVSARSWLDKTLSQDVSNNLLSFSGDLDQLPNQAYYFYLGMLMSMADVAETNLDIYAFPPAFNLGLADSAPLGFQVDVTPKKFQISLNFEGSPLDFTLQGNGMTQIALVGVLAAVALPAYQDYTLRAKVAESLGKSAAVQNMIVQFYLANGVFPGEGMAMELGNSFSDENSVIRVNPYTGVITIRLMAVSQLEGRSITLSPVLIGDNVSWSCQPDSEFDTRYLPSLCRPE